MFHVDTECEHTPLSFRHIVIVVEKLYKAGAKYDRVDTVNVSAVRNSYPSSIGP